MKGYDGMSWCQAPCSRVLLFVVLSLLPAAASADNMLTLGIGATVRPGASDVVIPINLATAEELTLLRFDLAFSPSLCAQLVSPQAITVRRAGRTTVPPAEEQVGCQSGRIEVGIFNLDGNPVISSGSGTVVEVDLGGLRSGATGSFPLTLQDVTAHRGPRSLSLGASGGELTIRCAAAADCEDGDACTTDTCNETSRACVHTCAAACDCPCPPSPAAGCFAPVHGQVRLALGPSLLWKFIKGPPVAAGGFGNPLTTTSYTLCLYDDGILKLDARAQASATRWASLGTKGFAYRDAAGTQDGITQLKLLGTQASSKLRAIATGANLPLPSPVSPTRFLSAAASVQVQLLQSGGSCYQTSFAPAQIPVNNGRLFIGRF